MELAIILVRPQMGENIGAAARACANFGAKDLRLVAPRDGWPNPKASDMAGRAINVIDDAQVFATTAEAIHDAQYVLAVTARDRTINLPSFTTREAVGQMRARGGKVALLFGPERTGLENEEVALSDGILCIPTAPEYSSLNLAQAVVVVLAEWFASQAQVVPKEGEPAAPRDELLGLYGQLEAALDGTNFWRIPEKKEIMWRNIRATLTRAGLTSQEVATWRGLIKALTRTGG